MSHLLAFREKRAWPSLKETSGACRVDSGHTGHGVGLKGARRRRVHLIGTAAALAPVARCRCATATRRGAFEVVFYAVKEQSGGDSEVNRD